MDSAAASKAVTVGATKFITNDGPENKLMDSTSVQQQASDKQGLC